MTNRQIQTRDSFNIATIVKVLEKDPEFRVKSSTNHYTAFAPQGQGSMIVGPRAYGKRIADWYSSITGTPKKQAYKLFKKGK